MAHSTESVWQFTKARANLSDVFDRALAEPQVIRHRNGDEVVIVSRKYFEDTKPTLKHALLASRGSGEQDDDPFDAALARIRAGGAAVLSRQSEG
jgi:PHD/YefM family antitoxin component YafN of YafNO toxin-antitoxin module